MSAVARRLTGGPALGIASVALSALAFVYARDAAGNLLGRVIGTVLTSLFQF